MAPILIASLPYLIPIAKVGIVYTVGHIAGFFHGLVVGKKKQLAKDAGDLTSLQSH